MKKFLQENEIYFRTVATVLLSIMALSVSVAAVLVSYQTYKIQKATHIIQEEIFAEQYGPSELEIFFHSGWVKGFSVNASVCNKKGSISIIRNMLLGIMKSSNDPKTGESVMEWRSVLDWKFEDIQLKKGECTKLSGIDEIKDDGNFTPFVFVAYFNGRETDYIQGYSNQYLWQKGTQMGFLVHNESIPDDSTIYDEKI
jgi:hypothetical protein